MTHPDGLQILIALDQLVNTLIGGYADETLSSRSWRLHIAGVKSWPMKVIDAIFFWQDDHCRQSYESELTRAHLPPSMREIEA